MEAIILLCYLHFQLRARDNRVKQKDQGRKVDYYIYLFLLLYNWRNIMRHLIYITCIQVKYAMCNDVSYIQIINRLGMSHIRSIRWGVPVRETLVLSHRLCEVGWPVPYLAAFISPVFPPGTHLLLGGQ